MTERRNSLDDEDLDAIEGRLAGTLRRFPPPPGLITQLRAHIHVPEREAIVVRLYEWERLFFVVGGVLSGAVALLTFARAMYHLFGRRS